MEGQEGTWGVAHVDSGCSCSSAACKQARACRGAAATEPHHPLVLHHTSSSTCPPARPAPPPPFLHPGGPNVKILAFELLGLFPVFFMLAINPIPAGGALLYDYGHGYWLLQHDHRDKVRRGHGGITTSKAGRECCRSFVKAQAPDCVPHRARTTHAGCGDASPAASRFAGPGSHATQVALEDAMARAKEDEAAAQAEARAREDRISALEQQLAQIEVELADERRRADSAVAAAAAATSTLSRGALPWPQGCWPTGCALQGACMPSALCT